MRAASKSVRVSIDQVQIGMYVSLPSGWLSHPFLLSRFLLKSAADLKKLKDSGIREVEVIPARSEVSPDAWSELAVDGDRDASVPPPAWSPATLIPDELKAALIDDSLSAPARSQKIYTHTRTLMTRLIESPTAENLKASKEVIFDLTDLVLSDDQTAGCMLRITAHDYYTYTHSVNVGVMGIMLAKALFGRSDRHDMHELGAGFFLHDMGKVKVDSNIINKPGRLDDAELDQVRRHPDQGYDLLKAGDALTEEARIVTLQHHERADGSGYPNGLRGGEIHTYGKICSIVDVYDALTAERSYKKPMTNLQALTVMKERMSGHFESDLFNHFVRLMGD